MADRAFSQFRYALEKKVVDLYADITFGLTGAPTLNTSNSKGIRSISRTSAGLFVVTLQDTYRRVLQVDATFIVAAGSFPAAPQCQIAASAVGTVAAPTVTLQFANPTGTTATDPANTERVLIHIALSNSDAI